MSNNPYKAPEAKTFKATEEIKKVPLSQAPGSKKLLIGIPVSIICGILAYIGIASAITRMLAAILGAYAFVGLIEVIGGESLSSSAKKWDSLPGWKKFIISTAVITISVIVFIGLMPIVAKYF